MKKFIFLTSDSFSGSTLVSFLLGGHPKIATISELTGLIDREDPNKYRCSCGEIISSCDFWKKIQNFMNSIGHTFSLKEFGTRFRAIDKSLFSRLQFSNLRYNALEIVRDSLYSTLPKYRKHLDNIIKSNNDLSNFICQITKKDIFFDASKRPNRIKYLKNNIECDEFKVIHLVKDGRGVFDSYKRYNPEMSDNDAILTWVRTNNDIERTLRLMSPENIYFLKYKNLATNPEKEITNLCNFIDVDFTSDIFKYRDNPNHIIGNNKMRLGSISEIYYDEKWKKSLTEPQLLLFDRIAGKLNRKYGYI